MWLTGYVSADMCPGAAQDNYPGLPIGFECRPLQVGAALESYVLKK